MLVPIANHTSHAEELVVLAFGGSIAFMILAAGAVLLQLGLALSEKTTTPRSAPPRTNYSAAQYVKGSLVCLLAGGAGFLAFLYCALILSSEEGLSNGEVTGGLLTALGIVATALIGSAGLLRKIYKRSS